MKVKSFIYLIATLALIGCKESSNIKGSTTESASSTTDIASLTQTCIACHGKNGVSNNTDWPSLAGQKAGYLLAQLRAYRDGSRVNDLMQPTLFEGISDNQLKEMAVFYSSQPLPQLVTNPDINKNGLDVRALCISCHGMQGLTVNDTWPNLAGQSAGYLKATLLDYKNGNRKNPVMEVIVSTLTEQQISDVAEYYSQTAQYQ